MLLDDWSVQQLRLTLFANERFSVSEALWKDLTGQDEAENRISVPAGRQYSGKMLNGLLALTITAARADIILAFDPANVAELGDGRLPVIGTWTEAVEPFVAAIEPFLEKLAAPVVRLAFGAGLLSQVASRERGYERLAELLQSVKVRCTWLIRATFAYKSMALADVRFGAHDGLKSDIARGPKSANNGHW
jgi:hypothetical protein